MPVAQFVRRTAQVAISFDDCNDKHGNQSEVVCQEDQILISLCVMKHCAPQSPRMHIASVLELQFIPVVSDADCSFG